jgi:tetratricopeptide (TPR) repeat protein
MGVVFQARHIKLERVVALKMLTSAALGSKELRQRFEGEARAAARLQHPHIAQIFEVGEWVGQPYVALEYVPGGTLAQRINAAPQPPKEAAHLMQTLALAVDYSHQRGILHRDLKPANILLSQDGQPKITDFGLAKWLSGDDRTTRAGEVIGTPSYMAPEQASGVVKKVGPACDIYALGSILYELLCGRPPFQTPDSMQTMLMVLSEEPIPPRRLEPQIPRDLETICLKCLEKSPARRYASAQALAEDLARFLRSEPIRARPVRTWERTVKWSRRHPAAAALICLATLFVLTVLIGSTWHNHRLQTELDRSAGLVAKGRDLSQWVFYEHIDQLTKLKGGTASREALVEQFRRYLEGLEQIAGDDTALAAQIAAAYERLGEIQGDPNYFNLGQTAEALQSYQRALAIRERLLTNSPDVFEARWHHTACLGRTAAVLAAMGNRDKSLQRYGTVIARLENLRREHADQQQVLVALSVMHGRIADLLEEAGQLDEALQRQQHALSRAHEAFGESPAILDHRRQLAQIHSRIGKLWEIKGDLARAKGHYQHLLTFAEVALRDHPADVFIERDLCTALIGIGDAMSHTGDLHGALRQYSRALAFRRAHYEADPDSVTVGRDLATILERIGSSLHAAKDFPNAEKNFREGLKITEQLAADTRDNVDLKRDLWIKHDQLGGVLLSAGQTDQAAQEFHRARELAQSLVEGGSKNITDLQGLAQAYDNLGTLEIRRLSPQMTPEQQLALLERAVDWYRQSLKAFQQIEQLAPLTPQQVEIRTAVGRKMESIEELLNEGQVRSSQ